MTTPGPGDALPVVDVQNGFLPGEAPRPPQAGRSSGLAALAARVDRDFP